MDTVVLVENQIEDGLRLLDRLREDGVVVSAACWVKPFEEDHWTLYIATPLVDEKGSLAAYGIVLSFLHSLGDAWITTSDVTLVSEKHPIVHDALDVLRRYPHRKPIRSPRRMLGGLSVEEVYVYMLGNVKVTVYGMMFGDLGGTLQLSLEPHNPDSKLTVKTGGHPIEYPANTGIDWELAAPDGATLKRDDLGKMVLAWDLYGVRMKSSANEVMAFAKLELHGFRILREPSQSESSPFR
jgi:hypothetical protein